MSAKPQKPNYLRMAVRQGKISGRMDSALEARFGRDLKVLKFPPWVRNYPFLEGSKKELDYAWPEWRFGVEVDGAVHRIRERARGDYDKHAKALIAGWTVLRVDRELVMNGEGVRYAEQLLFRARRAAEGPLPQHLSSAPAGVGMSDDSDLRVGPG